MPVVMVMVVMIVVMAVVVMIVVMVMVIMLMVMIMIVCMFLAGMVMRRFFVLMTVDMFIMPVFMLGFSLAFLHSIDQNMNVRSGDPALLRLLHLHLHARYSGLMEFLNKFFCRESFPVRLFRLTGSLQQCRCQHISRGSHTAVYI